MVASQSLPWEGVRVSLAVPPEVSVFACRSPLESSESVEPFTESVVRISAGGALLVVASASVLVAGAGAESSPSHTVGAKQAVASNRFGESFCSS